jgi:hypothetical protein
MLRLPRRCLLVAAGVLVAGCLSPTLPLPPPDRPDVSAPDASGLVRVQGIAVAQAEVIAWNHNTDLIAGQVTTDDARYDFTIKADAGDTLELWYIQGSDESPSILLTVPKK